MDFFSPESDHGEESAQKITRFPEPELPTLLSQIAACRHGANLALALYSDGLPGQTLGVLRDLSERLEQLVCALDPESVTLYGPPTISSKSTVPLALMSSGKARYRLQVLEELIRANLAVVEEQNADGVEVRDEISTILTALATVLRSEVHGAPDPRQDLPIIM
jgi:hypothetical protein